MIKDITVHIDDNSACGTRLSLAIDLARAHDAHVTGLHVVRNLSFPYYGEMPVPTELIEAEKKALKTVAQRCEAEFKSTVAKAKCPAMWRCVTGYPERQLALSARYADVLVLGQSNSADYLLEYRDVPDRVVLESSCPVLLTPESVSKPTLGKTIAVAWNGSREAVRAVNDALPLLKRADIVKVLTSTSGSDNALPTADICLHLARHGVKVEGHPIEATFTGVGASLLECAAKLDADMIVMGAYGHSRWRELILGGATQHVLEHAELPVFMSH